MISRLVFKKDFGWTKDKKVFKKGLKVNIEPGITVLVGDQGAGKSTLIELVRTWLEPDKGMSDRMGKRLNRSDVRATLDIEGEALDKVRLLAFDFEKDAARSSGAFDWGGPIDTVGFLMFGNKASHGEANKMALNMLLGEVVKEYKEEGSIKPTVILLDEPDAALSIASIVMLHMALRNLAHLGCQIIISAHHPFLLGCFEKLYSLEQKKWISYTDYLDGQVLRAPGLSPASLFISSYQSFDSVMIGLDKKEKTKKKAKTKKKVTKKKKKKKVSKK